MTGRLADRVREDALTLGQKPLGDGGQGRVYRVTSIQGTPPGRGLAYKKYKAQCQADLETAALTGLVDFRRSLDDVTCRLLDGRAAWPDAVVENGQGHPVGFTMSAVPADFLWPLQLPGNGNEEHCQVQHLLNDQRYVDAVVRIGLTDAWRLTFLHDVVEMVDLLHRHGVTVGDLSPLNIFPSFAGRPHCFFVDCDAAVLNGRSVLPQAQTRGWEVPQGEETATVYSDAYKVALLAVRLFAGDQDTKDVSAMSRFQRQLGELARAGLAAGPRSRPSIAEWVRATRAAVDALPAVATAVPVGSSARGAGTPTPAAAPPPAPVAPPPPAPPPPAPPPAAPAPPPGWLLHVPRTWRLRVPRTWRLRGPRSWRLRVPRSWPLQVHRIRRLRISATWRPHVPRSWLLHVRRTWRLRVPTTWRPRVPRSWLLQVHRIWRLHVPRTWRGGRYRHRPKLAAALLAGALLAGVVLADVAGGFELLPWSPRAADGQARQVEELLTRSKADYDMINRAQVAIKKNCGDARAIADFRKARDGRAQRLAEARSLRLDKLAHGAELQAAIAKAMSQSRVADTKYLQWAEIRARMCSSPKGPDQSYRNLRDPKYRDAAHWTKYAARAKQQVVVLWNPIARDHGYRERTRDDM